MILIEPCSPPAPLLPDKVIVQAGAGVSSNDAMVAACLAMEYIRKQELELDRPHFLTTTGGHTVLATRNPKSIRLLVGMSEK